MNAVAYLVIAADGFRAVFLERSQAEKYAAATHGTWHPLVMLEST